MLFDKTHLKEHSIQIENVMLKNLFEKADENGFAVIPVEEIPPCSFEGFKNFDDETVYRKTHVAIMFGEREQLFLRRAYTNQEVTWM